VLVPRTLRQAVEGRKRIELGVPPSSQVGDVVATLLTLYPKLRQYVADERRPHAPGFLVSFGKPSRRDDAQSLSEGSTLYLFSSIPKRLSDASG